MNRYKKIGYCAFAAAAVVSGFSIVNHLLFKLSSVKEHLYSKNGNYFEWRFGRIFYTKQGKGQPLLLIHDISCDSNEKEWTFLVDKLAKNYTVYTIDLLGCGRSDKPKITYTSYLYVQLINDFIKMVIGKKTNVMATGKSASVVVMACHFENEYFDKICLINPENSQNVSRISRTKYKLGKILLESPIIGTSIYLCFMSKKNIEKRFKTEYYAKEQEVSMKLMDCFHESAHLQGYSSKFLFSSLSHRDLNVNIKDALKQVDHSIFVIFGSKKENYQETMRVYENLNPAIETTVIANAKHLPHLECPDQIMKVCDIFF